MKLKFIGVGGAFAPMSIGQSNMLLISDTGAKMLIDCGMTAPYILTEELKLTHKDIDAVWISHLHADHIGGLEWFAFLRYFAPRKDANNNVIKPELYSVQTVLEELWENSLKGGLASIEGKVMHMTDYFKCIPIPVNQSFKWHEATLTPVQTIHVMSGYVFKHSYGLLIKTDKKTTFLTTDTQFAPYQLRAFYERADLIFHDCETSEFKSHVHAHYTDLNQYLTPDIKSKMWLYYCNFPIPTVKEDGFAGFVSKHQEFEI